MTVELERFKRCRIEGGKVPFIRQQNQGGSGGGSNKYCPPTCMIIIILSTSLRLHFSTYSARAAWNSERAREEVVRV